MKSAFYRYAAYPIALATPVALIVGTSTAQQIYMPETVHAPAKDKKNNDEAIAPIVVSYASAMISAP